MDEQVEEQPKKKRGWPAGKPRGPRRKNPPPQPPEPGPAPGPVPPQPKEFTEPVECTVVYKSGQATTFEASEWEETGDEVRFVSWPEKRGYKVVHYFRRSELAAMSILAPTGFFERHKATQADLGPQATPAMPATTRPGYVGGDPQVSIAPGRAVPNRGVGASVMGVPRSEITAYDSDGQLKKEVVGASMV